MSSLPEPWLRGPLPGIAAPLQPAAHAFVMAREDVTAAVEGITVDQLWAQPGGITPLGFHVTHISGSTDRLLTYARGESLSAAQKEVLSFEKGLLQTRPPLDQLLATWHRTVDAALQQLAATPESALTDARAVGRAQLPSTVLGLLFHAAEHAARHTGQIVTTAKMVRVIGTALVLLVMSGTAWAQVQARVDVTDQLNVATDAKAEEGFQPDADPFGRPMLLGLLENAATVHLELALQAGREYHIFAACDSDCSNLDTRVMNPDFSTLAEDVRPADVTRLDLTPAATAPHLFAISMTSCKTICYFGVVVLSRPARR